MRKRQWAAALLMVAILGGCGDSGEVIGVPEGERRSVTGVLLEVDAETIDQIDGFKLKAGDETFDVLIADDVEYGFPLGHLQEHLQDALPVKVEIENRDGELYALSIDDA